MPGCSVEREVVGSIARYRVCGRFDGACAWELAGRVEREALGELLLDFSQCGEFADYAVAVLANAVLGRKQVFFEGLRQHHIRLFKYFGVDAEALSQRVVLPEGPGAGADPWSEVA